ncbi:MAG: ABC transporter ATP-binding protein [Planctomycetes bacterium]|nr:ABC transporter ATP-binding protein [Planctomycetota bacterium]
MASDAPTATETLLELRDLRTYFDTDRGTVKAVDGVDLSIEKGKTLGIVGESGCGKSVTAYSIMRLIPDPPGRIAGGQILFDGKDIASLDEAGMRKIRGNRISMIFQEPMTSLNPVYTVGDQIAEAIVLHQKKEPDEAWALALDMLKQVGIPAAEERIHNYPHEMSGGMKQRVMIAMALVCRPALLIADEPTTALDVTIQAQILDILRRLQAEIGMSIWFITHDLGVVAEMAHEVAVMYCGKVIERADVKTLYKKPRHPYTLGLFKSLPQGVHQRGKRLDTIEGQVPNPLDLPTGCRFAPRCAHAIDDCKRAEPKLHPCEEGHLVACLRVERGEI